MKPYLRSLTNCVLPTTAGTTTSVGGALVLGGGANAGGPVASMALALAAGVAVGTVWGTLAHLDRKVPLKSVWTGLSAFGKGGATGAVALGIPTAAISGNLTATLAAVMIGFGVASFPTQYIKVAELDQKAAEAAG